MKRVFALLLCSTMSAAVPSQTVTSPLAEEIDRAVARLEPKVVAWRRDIHQHPELGNRETRTAKLIADQLRALGLEVRTGVAHTGVVGVLRGGMPGPVVALRSELDGLPVTEQVDVPFASREKATYNGQEVGVMHACGHDNHMAMLLGVAELFAGMKDRLPGTIKFVFQPAEEGPPEGEEGGAPLMITQGVLRDPKPDAMFALHVWSKGNVGQISYRSGSIMAAADRFVITIRGRQTHGALPWGGIDPIVIGAQVVLGMQTITSRQVDVTKAPSVITVGRFAGGIRNNIVPDEVVLEGTIRTFDDAMQADIHQRIKRTVESIAASAGATADLRIVPMYPVTANDPQLTERMLPTLERVAGKANVAISTLVTGAEDFSFYQREVPGLYLFLGSNPPGVDPETSPANHSPLYAVDERVLPLGVRTLAHLAADYLFGK
ncbi:MAG: amidohydrolase [Gammaproteobacteria bacterium]|nr:amidohydrolase [Gammaproteobacteria bacterium]